MFNNKKQHRNIRIAPSKEPIKVYLRDDIGCGIIQCQQCKSKAYSKLYSPTINALEPIIIPDINILLYNVQLLESPKIKNIVLLESILKEAEKNKAVYSRVQMLCKEEDKHVYIFSNDRHRNTYVLRNANEGRAEYNARLIRIAAFWFAKHSEKLSNDSTSIVYLVTHDKDLESQCVAELQKETQQVKNFCCISLHDYIAKVLPHESEMLDMSSSLPTADLTPRGKEFMEYITPIQALQGIDTGIYRKGKLKVSDASPFVGNVRVKNWVIHEKPVDSIFIYDKYMMNRAFDGDEVAVEIIDPSLWRQRGMPAISAGTSLEAALDLGYRPCGRVVAIMTVGRRQFCGSVCSEDVERYSKNAGEVSVLIQAKNPRIPRIRISTRQLSDIADKRLLVVVERWGKEFSQPQGRYVEVLGNIGDRDTEAKVILMENDIPHYDFSKDVYDCLPKGQWTVEDSEVQKRLDLRDLCVCSVDPLGCRDIDDALHYRVLNNGNVEVGVHIADVTHFVQEGTALDLEAQKRSTSVYLVDRRINMLPQLLTENLCSIVQDEDRYAFSIIWEFDKDTDAIVNIWYGRTIIRSRAALYYGDAQKIIDDPSNTSELGESLKGLMRLSKMFKEKRDRAGALSLASQEFKFKIDNSHVNPTDMQVYQTFEANSMIEEWMLLANAAAGAKVYATFPEWALLRRHQPPASSAFDTLNEALYAKIKERLDPTTSLALNLSLNRCVDPNDSFFNKLVRMLTTRCLRQAQYFCTGGVPYEEFIHFGLAMPIYTHFTSPIRRYADVIVHRQLAAAINIAEVSKNHIEQEKMEEISENINYRHEQAQKAGRDSQNLFTGFFLREFRNKGMEIPQETGYVIRVTDTHLFILVPLYGQEGKVSRADLPNEGNNYKLLDKVRVNIRVLQDGDAMRTRLEYSIAHEDDVAAGFKRIREIEEPVIEVNDDLIVGEQITDTS